ISYFSLKKLGRRCESFNDMSGDLQQELQRFPYGVVAVNYRYRSPLSLGHGCFLGDRDQGSRPECNPTCVTCHGGSLIWINRKTYLATATQHDGKRSVSRITQCEPENRAFAGIVVGP